MAFSYKVYKILQGKNGKTVLGTYTNDSGSTGGDIETGLLNVYSINLQTKGSAVIADAPVVNETLPKGNGTVTIVTNANEEGTFVAFGE